MGFFQERIITQGYLRISNPLIVEKFDDAQFLVFINRLFGMALSGAYLIYDWKKCFRLFERITLLPQSRIK